MMLCKVQDLYITPFAQQLANCSLASMRCESGSVRELFTSLIKKSFTLYNRFPIAKVIKIQRNLFMNSSTRIFKSSSIVCVAVRLLYCWYRRPYCCTSSVGITDFLTSLCVLGTFSNITLQELLSLFILQTLIRVRHKNTQMFLFLMITLM